jgi:hypothetical protein
MMIAGFSAQEMTRLTDCLGRLLPHVGRPDIAITGGVAMQVGMAGQGRPGTRSDITDLDLVAASIEVVRPSVVRAFLVSHYHVVRPGVPKFMIQLVDPLTRVRVDVFPDLAGSIADAREIRIGEYSIRVLPLERILEHKLLTLSRASRLAPIDPKHVRDAQLLGDLLGAPVPAIDQEAVAPDEYGTGDLACGRCELSNHPDWPLAPKEQVFDVLGWKGKPNARKCAPSGV